MKALRLLLYFALGLALGTASALSFAGTYTSYQGSAFRNINGTTYWKGDATSFSASKATVIESFKVGGTYITVPTFGQVTGAALSAVRMTPALAGGALLSYLAGQGLQLIADEWKKEAPSVPPSSFTSDSACGMTATQCAVQSGSASYEQFGATWTSSTATQCNWTLNGYPNVTGSCAKPAPCPAGYTYDSSIQMCKPGSGYVVADDTDWDRVRGVQPPAEVMADLCQRLAKLGTGCEVTAAGTLKASAPLSDWQTNPTTGERTREMANWNPKPNAADPFAGEITTTREKETPQTDPQTGQPTGTTTTTETDTTKDQDFCTLHPDSLACATFGKPDEPEKLDQTKQVSITPDTGFGPQDGTCPADLTYTVHLTGTQLRFSYQPVCTGLRTFRPVIIGMAWISGVLIFLGISRKAQG